MSDRILGALQENTLTLVCVSDKYCRLVRNAVPTNLFSTLLYRDIVERVYSYIDKFGKAPGAHLPDLLEDLLAEKSQRSQAVDSLLHSISQLSQNFNEEYVARQLEQFIRQQQLKLCVVEATKAIQDNDLDRAENVMTKAMKTRLALFDAGLTLDDVYTNLSAGDPESDMLLSGIPELDQFGHVPKRKESHVLMAPTKRGKTWWLTNLAKRALMQRLKVLVVTLEVSADIYGRRILQSMYSLTKREGQEIKIPYLEMDDEGKLTDMYLRELKGRPALSNKADVKELGRKLAKFRPSQNIIIKQFPTRMLTIPQLIAYMDGLEAQRNFIPDVLILDYPDLMSLDTSKYRFDLEDIYNRLRGIAIDRNMMLASVTQSNREGADAKQTGEKHVGESYAKIQGADTFLAYSQTKAEHELQLARLYVVAGRNDFDKYSVLITQAYGIGQFCLESRMLDGNYWALLEDKRGTTSNSQASGD